MKILLSFHEETKSLYLVCCRNNLPLAVVVSLLKHHILHLHKPCLGASLIFIQLHCDIADVLLCLRDHYMLQRIYAAAGLLNLRSH